MPIDPIELVPRALAGELRAIARLITFAERGDPEARPAFDALYAQTGRAHVVGVTGVPGSGKSTLVRALIQAARQRQRRVGVVAVDPSSPFSGGSILGDRIRMNDVSNDPGVFIRSMASRGSLGGIARATLDAVDVLDAAGYDLVFIETVGVGQDEVDITRAAHTVLVVSAPGLGDGVQAIKSGILEIADIHVVSKGDRPDANRAVNDLRDMLQLGAHPAAGDWEPGVLITSAELGTGADELLDQIAAHRAWLDASGQWAARVRAIAETRMLKLAEEQLRRRFAHQRAQSQSLAAQLVQRMARRELHPTRAAALWLAAMTEQA